MKEVQDVSVDTDVVLEKTALTITAADGLLYILNFQNPVTLLFWKTDRIPVGCSEWSFKNFVKAFYWNTYKSDITVTKKSYDALDVETNVVAD
jgi:hypothetical protein